MLEIDAESALLDRETLKRSSGISCKRIALSRHLMSAASISYDYYQDCEDHYARLQELSEKVDVHLYTCSWLTA